MNELTDFMTETIIKRMFVCSKYIDEDASDRQLKKVIAKKDEEYKFARLLASFTPDELNDFNKRYLEIIEESESNESLLLFGSFKALVRVMEIERKDPNGKIDKLAMKMLKEGNALKYCLDVMAKRHIGEKHILLLLLASGISTGLNKRQLLLHCMGVGGSGKGKTDAMEIVGKIFTNCDTIISASPKNIFYQADQDTLVDKGILFFPENDAKDNDEFNALERVLTDDKDIVPKHETVINQQAKSLAITQLNVMWRNSVGTSNDEDNQINNRYFIFNVDESTQQDKKVFEHILKNWNGNQITDNEDLEICKTMTDLIKHEPKKVIIPYLQGISLSNLTDRRTIKKILKLITSITYFNRFQRIQSKDYIFSNLEDFNVANLIWESINKYESSKLPEYETTILDIVSGFPEGISITQLSKLLKKDIGNVSRKIKQMDENGNVYVETHHISESAKEFGKRVNKPLKLVTCSLLYRNCLVIVLDDNIVKQAVDDLSSLNIEELIIPKSRYCSKRKKVRQSEREKLEKIFKNQIFDNRDVSYFLDVEQKPVVDIYNNNIYIYKSTTKATLSKSEASTITEQKRDNNGTITTITKLGDKEW